jgi:hypothetical protein
MKAQMAGVGVAFDDCANFNPYDCIVEWSVRAHTAVP